MFKNKIINDPVHGFITINFEILSKIINHPYFQRLRRIKQLGLTHLVYPGAMHTRFHHALGAMFLMDEAIKSLRQKGYEITENEELGAKVAILLHDIGHGPFSHALEHSIIKNTSHEQLSLKIMEVLNNEFSGELTTAIAIFKDEYPKRFLHQLVSSQLDVDRLDYLKRDSFYTGVTEGVIGTQRILKMIDVIDDELVVQEKGIYSIENFLNSRRIMYWQVYLHKTVLSAENLLINTLTYAKELTKSGMKLFSTPALQYFLESGDELGNQENSLENFLQLDDFDIISSIKVWTKSEDKLLSMLCNMVINRNLMKVEIEKRKFDDAYLKELRLKAASKFEIDEDQAKYLVFGGTTTNYFYDYTKNNIKISLKNGEIKDITEISDQFSGQTNDLITKHFICFPESIR